MGRKLALLIGNGMYANLPRLNKHRADVRYLAKALRNPNIGAFDNVGELTDKSSNTIRREIERFFIEDKTTDDLLLLYLTGHGETDRKGLQWYFTSINTDKERLSTSSIPASFIRELMNLTHSQRLVVILDACHASAFIEGAKGGAITEVATQQLAGYGRAILAAAGSYERAWEGHESIPLSTFTYHLVQGLTTGAADRDKDGLITVDEWFDYTDEQVRSERSDQTPRKDVRTQRGKLVIAHNPFEEVVADTSNPNQGKDIHQLLPANVGQESSLEVIPPQTFSVGGRKVNIIILARGYYGPQEIQCFYDRTYKHLPADLEQLRDEYERNNKEQKSKGILGLPYNSPMYKLLEFDLGHRTIIEGEEVANLHLKFSPTDYFSQIVTDLKIGHPIREKYREKAGDSIIDRPVPEFSTILGVNLNVITADNYLVITERSRQANVAGGKLHISVGENLLRPRDSGITNAPDPFLAVIRGAREELGITLKKDDIVFKTFTVIPDYCQYSLIATIHIAQTHNEVDEIWHNVIPADKWESRGLLFQQHDLETIARFVTGTWDRWFHVALAAVVLSLLDVGYSWEEVNRAFWQAWSRQSPKQ